MFTISRSTLSFQDHILEKTFKQAYFKANLQIGRICHILAIVLYTTVGLWDGLIIEPARLDGWLVSICAVTLIFISGLGLSYLSRPLFSRFWQQLYTFYVIATGTGVTYAAISAGQSYPHYNFIGIIFCLFFCYTIIRLTFVWAALAGNAIVAIYITGIAFCLDFNNEILSTDLMYLSSFNLLGMMVNYALELMSRRDFMLNELLKVADSQTKELNTKLEGMVRDRTEELHSMNRDLQNSLEREKQLVSKLEQEEEVLQKSLYSLQQAEHIAKLGYFEKSWTNGKETIWSNGLYTILDLPPDSTPLDFHQLLNFIDSDHRPAIEKYFIKGKKSQQTIDTRFPITTATQADKEIHLFADIKYSTTGQPVLARGILRDITAEKQVEDNLKQVERQLIQAQKMESIGRLAGGVAHDYNNMISIILGYSEMTLDELPETSPLRGHIEEILDAARRSSEITRQLLAFARQQTIAPKVIDLNESMDGMLKMLRRLIGEDIDLRWFPGAQLWPMKIDPSQVNQLLANLCVNARDAIMGTGSITIETHNEYIDESYCSTHSYALPGHYIQLIVSDNGSGIPPEVIEHIFEPFYTTKKLGKGTGLGLSTVYGIVKQNNGYVNVYSEPEKGTTFKLYFPRHHGQKSATTVEQQPAVLKGAGETLLIVEDDNAILNLTQRILSGSGYLVLTAGSPSDALSIARSHPSRIDLLITDVIMPEMNGRALSDQLRSECPGIKTIFMSGYTANVIAHHGVLDEGVEFINKPFTKNTLTQKVREVLDSPLI